MLDVGFEGKPTDKECRLQRIKKMPTLPYLLEAEQYVLASILIDREAIAEVLALLQTKDFYREEHKYIFDAMLNLHKENVPIDIVTVFNRLRAMKQDEFAGGLSYLTGLLNSIPNISNVWYYAKMVKEKSLSRKAAQLGLEISELGAKEDLEGCKEKAVEIQNLNLTSDIPLSELYTEEDLERLKSSKRFFCQNLHNLTYRLPFMKGEVIYIAG